MNCVETYLPLKGRDAEEYASLASAQESPEIQAMQMTWADKIEAKGIKKGLAAGLEKGREQGLRLGMERGSLAAADRLRRTVVRQLRQRFGRVPAPLRKRLTAIRMVDELGAIADRIFEVQSIEELGLGG
jgi:flagellar biosynthesis/type III secretory pathway protein FliH